MVENSGHHFDADEDALFLYQNLSFIIKHIITMLPKTSQFFKKKTILLFTLVVII